MDASAYVEKERRIPVRHDVDVLVVGAGPAGIGAAIAAARAGAKTMLVEISGSLGGAWTMSMQIHMTCLHDGKKVIVEGVMREISDRLHVMGGAEDAGAKVRNSPSGFWTGFDPEMMKCLLDDMVTGAGVELLLHTMCVGAIVEDNSVKGVIIENKSGRQIIMAGVTIDCSGDADVAYFAGAPTFKGRPDDGKCQPPTVTFLMGGVDIPKITSWGNENRELFRELECKAREKGELTIPVKMRMGTLTMHPGITYHNQTRIINVDPLDASDLTRAEIEGRRQVMEAVRFYKKYISGFEKSFLLQVAPQLGLRESRRIDGEYMLVADDVLSARKFDDGIARQRYYIDMHNPEGEGAEGRSSQELCPQAGAFYDVPYRTLVPKKIDQLLVAGRCISADREALGSTRTTVCCVELGEAAGTAAALALKKKIRVREVDGKYLKKMLFKD